MTIFELTEFILNNSGPAGEILHHHLHGSGHKPVHSFFFTPYKDTSEAALKGLVIFTAPFTLTLHSLYCVVAFFEHGIRAIHHFIHGTSDKWGNSIGGNHLVESLAYLAVGLISLVVAALSPLINLCDFVGSGISSLVGSVSTIPDATTHPHI